MFEQSFKTSKYPNVFILKCGGDKNKCDDIPQVVSITCPCGSDPIDYALSNKRMGEITDVMVAAGLSEKCIDCLKKVK